MITKIQIKSLFGELLFEHESENNTLKKTLTKAVIRGTYLIDADLEDADLTGANLRGTYLRDANLRGTYLRDANLPMYSKWSFSFNEDKLSIGCKTKTIKEWDIFFESNEEFETPRNTQEFKQIQAMYEAYKSYYKFLQL